MIPKSAVNAIGELLIKAQKNVDDFPPLNSVRYSKPKPRVPSQPMTPSKRGKSVPGFEDYTGGKVRREKRPQLPDEYAEEYRKYGQQRIKETGSLKGQMKVNHEGMEFDLKQNSKPLKSGEPSVKVRSKEGRQAQDNRRQAMEAEQGGDDYQRLGGHHRAGVDLVDRLQEGLTDADRVRIRKSAKRALGAIGGEDFNLDLLPEDVHKMVHKELNKMGFDARRMDFSQAPLLTRLKFIQVLKKALAKIDEKTYEAMRQRALSQGREGASNY